MRVCMRVYVYVHENVYSYVCAHVYVYVHMCVYVNVPRPELQVSVRAIMCVYTYIHMFMHVFTTRIRGPR